MIKTFKKGELMTISKGQYSDYCVMGLFKVLIDFDAEELSKAWAEEAGAELSTRFINDIGYRFKEGHKNYYEEEAGFFLGWLNKNGYIEDVDYRELSLGDCGMISVEEKTTDTIGNQ